MNRTIRIGAVLLLSVGAVIAQQPDGYELGNMMLRADVGVLGGYDNRVVEGPDEDGDAFAEAEAGVRLDNLPARFDLTALARYGYRYYNEYSALDDDFYTLGGTLASRENPLQWGVSLNWKKSLDYDTFYDADTGQEPEAILTGSASRRLSAGADLAYDKSITEKTSIRPEYRFTHYYQELDSSEDAEWQIHDAVLQMRRRQNELITYYAGLSYSLQSNEEEDGLIGTALVGAEGQATDKTSWLAEIGFSHADYDLSGTEQGVVTRVRGEWTATDKISVYAFGGNNFRPGYSGGAARWVYRLGYGASWQIIDRLGLKASLLHDYQDTIGDNAATDPTFGDTQHFFNTSVWYLITDHLRSELGYKYVKDDETPDQQVVTLRLSYLF